MSILTNALVAAVGRVINVLLGIGAMALITRSLGPENFGLYVVLFSAGAILQLVADAGLYLTLTREVARRPTDEHRLLSHSISLRLALLGIVTILGLFFVVVQPSLAGLTKAAFLLAGGFIFQSLSQLLLGMYQYYQIVWRATVADIVGRCLQLVTLAIVIREQPTVEAAAGAFLISAGVAFLLHHLFLPLRQPWRVRYDRTTWKQLMTLSWPIGVALVVNALYFRLDTFVLSWLRSPTEVGWYGLAYRVIESALFLPAMVGGLLLPRLTESWEVAPARARQYLEESIRLMFLVAAFLVVILFMRGSAITIAISGESFRAAGPLLQVLSLALAAMCFGTIFGFALVAAGQQRALLRLYTILVLGVLVADLLIIPLWGAGGAAWVTVGTELVAMLWAGRRVYQLLPFTVTWSFIARTIATASISAAALQLFPSGIPLVLELLAAGCIYLGLGALVRLATIDQVRLLGASHAEL